MHNAVFNYLKMPGPLLGVGTDAAKLKCGAGSAEDADEKAAAVAIDKMVADWVDWEQTSGIDHAIREKRAQDKAKIVKANEEVAEVEKTRRKKELMQQELKRTNEQKSTLASIQTGINQILAILKKDNAPPAEEEDED